MCKLKRILLTGGGSAGHVNPALAIGSALGNADTRYLYVGVRGRVEEEVVPREGIPVKFVRSIGYPGGRPSFALARFFFELLIGSLQSVFILVGFRPSVIIGTGGYASAPVIIAAFLLRKLRISRARVFLHEQNASPGRLNQLMGRFAHQVFVTFPETLSYFQNNGVLTGYPLRKRIQKVSREEALSKLDFRVPDDRKLLLVFGGSQGSRAINRGIVDALRFLLPYGDRLFIVHGVGLFKTREYHAVEDTQQRLGQNYTEEERRRIHQFYLARPFFHNIELLYTICSLVIARGGAGSLNEISAMGLPAIIIPKSNLAGDHQVMNARAMAGSGGCEIIYEEIALQNGRMIDYVDGRVLADKIVSLFADEERLAEMGRLSRAFLRQDAVSDIVARVQAAVGGKSVPAAAPVQVTSDRPLPGNRALLAALEKSISDLNGSPEVAVNPADCSYFKSRAALLLIHPKWEERNVGVKLLGLLKAKEKIPLLRTIFEDRRRASILKRLFGGDFEQVGFIRRNVITALKRLNEVTPDVEAVLLLAFKDPYYEVRAEAARTAAFFGCRITLHPEFVSSLLGLIGDRNLEVAAEAAEALGKLGDEKDALPALLSMKHFKYWKVRSAALKGLLALVERGRVTDYARLKNELPGFILTATDFSPRFEIKSDYSRLMEAVSNKRGQPE